MKKTFAYITAAAFLGLAIILVPLFLRAEMRLAEQAGRQGEFSANTLSTQFRELEGVHTKLSSFSLTDFGILAVCFVVALAVYVWFRSKRATPERQWTGHVSQ